MMRRRRTKMLCLMVGLCVLLMIPSPLHAEAPLLQSTSGDGDLLIRLVRLSMVMMGATMIPILLLCLTSFVKFLIVFSLLRHALGTPQVPPATVVTGLAILFSLIVMTPVAREVWRESGPLAVRIIEEGEIPPYEELYQASMPIRRFLDQHAQQDEVSFFSELAAMQPNRSPAPHHRLSMQVLAPAFLISELKDAFHIGFLLFIPFMVIDILVANLLTATGMLALTPGLVSLPFKLVFFVASDGWLLLTRGLISGYLQLPP